MIAGACASLITTGVPRSELTPFNKDLRVWLPQRTSQYARELDILSRAAAPAAQPVPIANHIMQISERETSELPEYTRLAGC